MPRLIARAARVGIDVLPHVDQLADPVFAAVVELSIDEAYAIRREEAEAADKASKKGGR